MFGFININKPSGMTSHKVIAVLRKITGIKQIGHAGTLDPLASGVLPVAIGKASKLIDYLPSDKSYIAGMYLGKESDTYDIEGNITENNCSKVSLEQIKEVLNSFRGEITQIPPAYSAVHYNGKRLYELARSGKIPEDIPSRKITVYKNEIVDFDYETQNLTLDIACSKGTYIRTIVNDIGRTLNCGAVMYKLIRTLSSGMDIKNSIILNEETTKEDILKHLIPPQNILPLGKAEITEEEYKYILNGNKFKNNYNLKDSILLLKDNKVIALAYAEEEYIQPKKVLL
jgi:tRNA pseudouridine55 synthase